MEMIIKYTSAGWVALSDICMLKSEPYHMHRVRDSFTSSTTEVDM